MTGQERRELVAEIVAAMETRGCVEGARLLDLMRVEQQLVDALQVVRREIALIVRQAADRRDGEARPPQL